jgi:GAF domain-containing protein
LALVAFLLGRARSRALFFGSEAVLWADFYAAHLHEVLVTLRRVIEGGMGDVTFDDFVERGVLDPAKEALAQAPGEEVRLSILLPDPQHVNFLMRWASGHSLESRLRYSLAIAGSFTGNALGTGEVQWSNEVDADPRFRPHPRARPGREYGSLVSVPIIVHDRPAAVLSAISTRKGAFSPADVLYIALIGALLGLASWNFVDGGIQTTPRRKKVESEGVLLGVDDVR